MLVLELRLRTYGWGKPPARLRLSHSPNLQGLGAKVRSRPLQELGKCALHSPLHESEVKLPKGLHRG